MITRVMKSRARIAITVAITTWLFVAAAHAQGPRRYGKSAPKARTGPRQVRTVQHQMPTLPMVETPVSGFEASTGMASQEFIPSMPSYESPAVQAPATNPVFDAYNGVPVDGVVDSGQIVDGQFMDGQIIDGETFIEPQPLTNFEQASTQQAPIYSTGTWFMNGDWYGQADIVWLSRNLAEEVALVNDVTLVNSLGVGAVYRLDEIMDYDYAPGTRLSIGRMLGRDAANRDHRIEFTYFGGFGWESAASVVSRDGNGLNTLLNSLNDSDDVTETLFGSDVQRFNLSSDLNSFELNYRVSTRPSRDYMAMQPDGRWVRHGAGTQMRSLLGGVRYISMGEEIAIRATAEGPESATQTTRIFDSSVTTEPGSIVDDLVRGLYTVNTDNDMMGFQFGGELMEQYDEWGWGLRGKIGGLLNFAGRQSLIDGLQRDTETVSTMEPAFDDDGNELFIDALGGFVIDNPTTVVDETAGLTRATDQVVTTTQVPRIERLGDARDAEKVTFLAEIGAFGTYQIRPNFHFKAAYDFILLAGVGSAPKNLNLINGFPKFNVGSSAFFHGGSFGFVTTW